MRKLAAWIMARRGNSLAATSGFAAMGFAFPPLLVMSLASLGLVTMRKGSREGLVLLLACIALFAAMSLALTQSIRLDLVILAALWVFSFATALVYRVMATPAWMINAAGFIGVICVVAFYLVMEDPAGFWLALLEEHLKPLFMQRQMLASEVELDQFLQTLAGVLTGGMAALVSIILIASLLLARWWQALLYNPGGFRREFHGLRLGKPMALLLVVLLLVSLIGKFAVSTDMATVIWLLFFFQGLAVVHGLIAMAGLGIGWLISLYVLLALVPNYASPVLSGLGLVDAWFDFRRRVVRQDGPDIDEQ